MSYTILPACTGCTACVKVCPVDAIRGVRKALHVIEAAVCIDCGACGRICPYQTIIDDQGMLCQMVKRSQWLVPHIEVRGCISCGVCLEVCPTSVLDFVLLEDYPGRPIARLRDVPGCIGCSFCAIACPVDTINMVLSSPRV